VRVVVTGMGAVTPFGYGVDVFASGIMAGASSIRPLDLFDTARHRTKIAGKVPELDVEPLADRLRPRELRRLSRTDRFALCAALEACEDAGLALPSDDEDVGLFFGSSTGGMFEGEEWYRTLRAHERAPVSALASHQYDGPAATVARQLGLTGPVQTAATACSAAAMAIGSAVQCLRSGASSIVLAGGSDALCELTYAGFNALRAVDENATRPFRADRGGLSLGEGAGMLVLETEAHARARGARVLAEIVGVAGSCDAGHMTAPHPEGRGAEQALRSALVDAGLEPDDVDFVNAHGTGTPLNDAAEGKAVAALFGERGAHLPLTSTKGAVGHTLGACGAIEAVASILCLRTRSVHPTPGGGAVDPECGVDLVLTEPRALDASKARTTCVSVNLAFGGANGALVLRSVAEDAS